MQLEWRQALWLPILLLHALLLLAHLPRPPAAATRSESSVVVQLLPARTPPRPVAAPQARVPPRPALAVRPPHADAAPARATEPVAPAEVLAPEPVAALPATASPAPAPVPLLQTEATRQAIRLATRAPLLAERAASASDAPARETAQQRFGREVARTAHGNCLKGEFPGAGAGLLSLPFFLVAEASGRCQK